MSDVTHAHAVVAALERRSLVPAPHVDDLVRASWLRSVSEHGLEPDRFIEPDVLSHAELVQHRAPIEEFSALASPEVDRLYERLIDHAQVIALFDAQGVIVNFRSADHVARTCFETRVMPGSIWTEERQGTTGAGLCLREKRPLSVVMGEHFLTRLAGLTCTVAPIFGQDGRLAGVLNVTSTQATSHALQSVVREVVTGSARRIENRYFDRRHDKGRIVRLSRHDDFCDGAAEARLALDDRGRIVDATPSAIQLLVRDAQPDDGCALLGRSLGSIVQADNLERLLEDPAAQIAGANGRVHMRLAEPRRRAHAGGAAGRSAPQTRPMAPVGQSARAAPFAPVPPGRNRGPTAGPSLEEIAGGDSALAEKVRLAQRLHARGLALLLQGETGSGKTQLARALHARGPHAQGGFVAVNCAAIPGELIESELFGYRPGAFTGAAKEGSAGRLLGADGGTLFLDEIGDMPLALQARLLHVLSEGEFVPLGATSPVQVRFALISASLRNLDDLVREGRFRADLYYRLSGASIHLPPLRLRLDRMALVDRAFEQAATQAGHAAFVLTGQVRAKLDAYPWPGNIRELAHVARFAMAVSETGAVDERCLPAPLIDSSAAIADAPARPARPTLRAQMAAPQLAAWLQRHHWNVSAAAAALGVSRATLHRRIKEADVRRPEVI